MDLTSGSIFFALACGAAAVVYGAVAARWVLALRNIATAFINYFFPATSRMYSLSVTKRYPSATK